MLFYHRRGYKKFSNGMNQNDESIPQDFHKIILLALKARNKLDFKGNDGLPMLHVVKKYIVENGLDHQSGRRRAIDLLLDDAIAQLLKKDKDSALLLKNRFEKKIPNKELVDIRKGLTENVLKSKQRYATKQLAIIVWEKEQMYRRTLRSTQYRVLPNRIRHPLVGVESRINHLLELLLDPNAAYPLLLHGIGGIGKTSLAEQAVSLLIEQLKFDSVVWLTVNNNELQNQTVELPYLHELLLEKLEREHWLTYSDSRLYSELAHLFNERSFLVVIDNIECELSSSLLTRLHEWGGRSRFLLTSRLAPEADADCMSIQMKQLTLQESAELIWAQAKRENVESLSNLKIDEINPIYDLVGGNPLAIKLVVGLVNRRPLFAVIEDIRQAQTKKMEGLYTFIYRKAWQALSKDGRLVLEVMYSAGDGGYEAEDMLELSQLEPGRFWDAVDELMKRSLLEKSTHPHHPTYSIHRLTASFLKIEIVRLPSELEEE